MILDHLGIAVADIAAALAFYRDALGLTVTEVEEVATQRVRAHFIPVGSATLELLEATAPDSPIAKYLEKRSPGLHHLTLRVDDIDATIARLQAAGVRLIDQAARPGAEGARVAFIHPAAAHGVLVELKQGAAGGHRPVAPPADPSSAVPRLRTAPPYALGALQLVSLSDGHFHLDGGAMFGVVPRTLWETRLPPDAKHRVPMGLRPLLVKGEQLLLIDAGCGDTMSAKQQALYGFERQYHLDHALAEAGVRPEDIEVVLATHLHFDHAGGFTVRGDDGRVVPRFPNARYVAHAGEWEDATHPHERNRASYLPDTFVPLQAAGVLSLVGDDAEIMPGVRLRRSGGHTRHHQVVMIESQGQTAVFAADMLPTAIHVPDAWIMGYDLYPMETLAFKRAFAREAIERDHLVFFEHDPSMAAGLLRESSGSRTVERVI